MFIRARPVAVGFILERTGCSWLHSSSLRSFGPALAAVLLIRIRWVHLYAPLGTFGIVGFIRARTGSRSFHLSALSRASFSLVFAWFILARRGGH